MKVFHKILLAILAGLGLFSSVYVFILFGLDQSEGGITQIVDHLYIIVSVVLVLAVLLSLLLSLFRLFSDGKAFKTSLIFLLLFGVVLLVSYVLASDEPVRFIGSPPSSMLEAKISGMGIIAFYILFILSILSLMIASFSRVARR